MIEVFEQIFLTNSVISHEFSGIFIFILALCAERWLTLPHSYHPSTLLFVIFTNLQKRIYKKNDSDSYQLLSGWLAIIFPLSVILILCYGLLEFASYPELLSGLILYLCLESQKLEQSIKRLPLLLRQKQKSAARDLLRVWLRRETKNLSEPGLIKAAIETLTLRSSRLYFSVLFFYLLGGPIAALSYRILTIMHSSWSKLYLPNTKFLQPIKSLTYALEWLPSRLVAICIALSKETKMSFHFINHYGNHFYQKNTGWLLSCMSAALKVQLGGPAFYSGRRFAKIRIGQYPQPSIYSIKFALSLINRVKVLWFCFIILSKVSIYIAFNL
ncbi:cobalamin biosynthesis protein CobD/CbiB [Pseudoalteromonas denitrificans]|uniref:Adenosylcobinamide-phosphate synthase n=1 Tax=Pseudoalteromonas denitrificans DSM 6059 TaxID=1123010 RepID=A0A1I1PN17_9GAMM|nr:regulatory signaling modulator protein AmpE [Pseudoalteromonas denitrificans]SFD11145.1 adenosylcobinamide-phosphate synthase [Pseudoalteromonas denitrificans DSM 6059]